MYKLGFNWILYVLCYLLILNCIICLIIIILYKMCADVYQNNNNILWRTIICNGVQVSKV